MKLVSSSFNNLEITSLEVESSLALSKWLISRDNIPKAADFAPRKLISLSRTNVVEKNLVTVWVHTKNFCGTFYNKRDNPNKLRRFNYDISSLEG